MSAQDGRKTAQRKQTTAHKYMGNNMFKIECCGSNSQLPTERTKQKFVDF
jgi:hypothetical protein